MRSDNVSDGVTVEHIMLERLRFGIAMRMPTITLLDPHVEATESADQVCYHLEYQLLGNRMPARTETTKIYYPDGPWEMWKWKYAPKWLINRWPVRNKEVVTVTNVYHYNVCPHINTLFSDDRDRHILHLCKEPL